MRRNTAAPTEEDMPLISQPTLSPHQLHSQTKNRPSQQPTAQKKPQTAPCTPSAACCKQKHLNNAFIL